jgi:hypothetical protein
MIDIHAMFDGCSSAVLREYRPCYIMLISTCEYVAAGVQASGGNQDVWHHPDVQFLGMTTHQHLHNTCCQDSACHAAISHEADSRQCQLSFDEATASIACRSHAKAPDSRLTALH